MNMTWYFWHGDVTLRVIEDVLVGSAVCCWCRGRMLVGCELWRSRHSRHSSLSSLLSHSASLIISFCTPVTLGPPLWCLQSSVNCQILYWDSRHLQIWTFSLLSESENCQPVQQCSMSRLKFLLPSFMLGLTLCQQNGTTNIRFPSEQTRKLSDPVRKHFDKNWNQ